MRDHAKPTPDERGTVTLWIALTTFTIIICIGIAVDLGGHVHAQQRARNIAAQAARTGAQEVTAADAIRGHTPRVDNAAAHRAAATYLTRAGVTGTVTVRAGGYLDVTVTDSYTPMFLTSLGVGTLTVTGESTARLVRAVQGAEQ